MLRPCGSDNKEERSACSSRWTRIPRKTAAPTPRWKYCTSTVPGAADDVVINTAVCSARAAILAFLQKSHANYIHINERTLIEANQNLPFKTRSIWKCWAHLPLPLRAVARRLFYIAIHQVSLLSHAATVARRLHIDVHDNDDDDNSNAWQKGPLWPIERAQLKLLFVMYRYIT